MVIHDNTESMPTYKITVFLVICLSVLAVPVFGSEPSKKISTRQRLWDREPSFWQAAQKVTIKKPVQANNPPRTWVGLSNYQIKVGLWGPAEQLTLSLRKTDVWDRRMSLDPFPTIQEIRQGAFDEQNREDYNDLPTRGWGGYLSPKGGRVYYQGWSAYEFPVSKDTGQVLLFLPDFNESSQQTEATTRCDDKTTRLQLRKGGAEANLTYLTMMTRNIIAIDVQGRGLSMPAAVRLYRYRDTCRPGETKEHEWYKLRTKDYDFSKDAAWNGPLDLPESSKDGRFFWIRQKMPPERTFPDGFEYVLMGMISGETPILSTANNQQHLGTPGGQVRPDVYGSAATARMTARKDIKFIAFITIVTTNDGGNLLGKAKRRLLDAEKKGMAGLVAENTDWYKDFYAKRDYSRIFDGSPKRAEEQIPDVFDSWTFAHSKTSKPDPTRYECDSWNDNFFENDKGAWHGIPCYNELHFTDLDVMNRSDRLDYYPKLIKMWLEASKRNARDVFGLDGMFGTVHGYVPPVSPDGPYPHSIYTWEFAMESPAQVMRVGWNTFDYSGDEAYLAETVYPALRELAIFYSGYVQKGKGGFYHVTPTLSSEHWGWTYRFEYNRDGAAALTMIKWTLNRTVEASEILGLDADMRDGWLEIAGNMAPYPTYETSQGPVFSGMAGVNPLDVPLDNDRGYNFFGGVAPTVLGDDINLDSDPEQIETMVRTAHMVGGGHKHQSGWENTDVFHLLGQDKNIMYYSGPDSWWYMKDPVQLKDPDSIMTAAIRQPERLINSRSGWIHLFPCMPDKITIAFKRLQARGGFAVSAEKTEGETTYVLIESRRNVKCRIWNPWPDSPVRLYRNGKKSEELKVALLEFDTHKGESIELVKKN